VTESPRNAGGSHGQDGALVAQHLLGQARRDGADTGATHDALAMYRALLRLQQPVSY